MTRIFVVLLIIMSMNSVAQKTWESLDEIKIKWIKVERDSLGYLVYEPCNGETPMIIIDSEYLKIHWQLEDPRKLAIKKITRLTGSSSFYISASDKYGNMEFTAIMKDGKQKLVLWTFGEIKWVMTPYENKNMFRQIDNPCPTERKPEIQFLPIEY